MKKPRGFYIHTRDDSGVFHIRFARTHESAEFYQEVLAELGENREPKITHAEVA